MIEQQSKDYSEELEKFNNRERVSFPEQTQKDPWIHRSSKMQCKTCMWFVRKESETSNIVNVGRCRRHSPSMNGYPVVYISDWCGDHKIDENKI